MKAESQSGRASRIRKIQYYILKNNICARSKPNRLVKNCITTKAIRPFLFAWENIANTALRFSVQGRELIRFILNVGKRAVNSNALSINSFFRSVTPSIFTRKTPPAVPLCSCHGHWHAGHPTISNLYTSIQVMFFYPLTTK